MSWAQLMLWGLTLWTWLCAALAEPHSAMIYRSWRDVSLSKDICTPREIFFYFFFYISPNICAVHLCEVLCHWKRGWPGENTHRWVPPLHSLNPGEVSSLLLGEYAENRTTNKLDLAVNLDCEWKRERSEEADADGKIQQPETSCSFANGCINKSILWDYVILSPVPHEATLRPRHKSPPQNSSGSLLIIQQRLRIGLGNCG